MMDESHNEYTCQSMPPLDSALHLQDPESVDCQQVVNLFHTYSLANIFHAAMTS